MTDEPTSKGQAAQRSLGQQEEDLSWPVWLCSEGCGMACPATSKAVLSTAGRGFAHTQTFFPEMWKGQDWIDRWQSILCWKMLLALEKALAERTCLNTACIFAFGFNLILTSSMSLQHVHDPIPTVPWPPPRTPAIFPSCSKFSRLLEALVIGWPSRTSYIKASHPELWFFHQLNLLHQIAHG